MSTFVKVMQKKLWPLFFPDTVYTDVPSVRLFKLYETDKTVCCMFFYLVNDCCVTCVSAFCWWWCTENY